ncbi:MAG: phosphoribosylglycinamide formyltransferase [Pseudomonadota bacterium]
MTPVRVGILISGGGSNMCALVDDMGQPDHQARPALVLSNRPDAGGLSKAAERGVTTAVVDHRDWPEDRTGFEAAMQKHLVEAEVDLVCLAGFMRILTGAFVSRWAGRMLNIHPSLLPKYPGLDTHARATAARDAEHGCTVHEVIPELDAGPILGQARVPIQSGETAESLAARLLPLEHRLYPAVLRRFAAGDRTRIEIP